MTMQENSATTTAVSSTTKKEPLLASHPKQNSTNNHHDSNITDSKHDNNTNTNNTNNDNKKNNNNKNDNNNTNNNTNTISIVQHKQQQHEQQISSSNQLRAKVKADIYHSEKSYVNCLNILVDNFIRPLKKWVKSNSKSNNDTGTHTQQQQLTQEQLKHICSNVEMLDNFHLCLVQDLSKQHTDVADVFIMHADFFKMYDLYMNGFERCLNTIHTLRTSDGFQQFLSERCNESGGYSMLSYLIMPVERMPRYMLFLRELQHHTHNTHPKCAALQEAIQVLQPIVMHVKQQQRHFQNMAKVLQIQNRIHGCVSLFLPNRRLIR